MFDIENMRKTIAKSLEDYIGIEVIRSNQTGDAPAYPYLSYTITTVMSENNGTWGEYEDNIDRKPVTQTWSITVQSDKVDEAMKLAIKAREWFDRVGTIYLNDNDVIVQSVGVITSRDNLISVEYEYRNGFDVVFWLLSEVEKAEETAEYIETVAISNIPPIEKISVDELNEQLEQRLDGDI